MQDGFVDFFVKVFSLMRLAREGKKLTPFGVNVTCQ